MPSTLGHTRSIDRLGALAPHAGALVAAVGLVAAAVAVFEYRDQQRAHHDTQLMYQGPGRRPRRRRRSPVRDPGSAPQHALRADDDRQQPAGRVRRSLARRRRPRHGDHVAAWPRPATPARAGSCWHATRSRLGPLSARAATRSSRRSSKAQAEGGGRPRPVGGRPGFRARPGGARRGRAAPAAARRGQAGRRSRRSRRDRWSASSVVLCVMQLLALVVLRTMQRSKRAAGRAALRERACAASSRRSTRACSSIRPDGRVESWNDAAERATGVPRAPVASASRSTTALPAFGGGAGGDAAPPARRRRHRPRRTTSRSTSNGVERVLELRIFPFDGGATGFFTDVTARIRHEAELRQARDAAEAARPRQERVPRPHEPRDPHADERRARHDRAAARHAAQPRAARVRDRRPRVGRAPDARHQRHPRFLEDRGRQAAHGERAASSMADVLEQALAIVAPAADAQGPGAARRAAARAAAAAARRSAPAAAGADQPARQRRQVHRARRRHAAPVGSRPWPRRRRRSASR